MNTSELTFCFLKYMLLLKRVLTLKSRQITSTYYLINLINTKFCYTNFFVTFHILKILYVNIIFPKAASNVSLLNL